MPAQPACHDTSHGEHVLSHALLASFQEACTTQLCQDPPFEGKNPSQSCGTAVRLLRRCAGGVRHNGLAHSNSTHAGPRRDCPHQYGHGHRPSGCCLQSHRLPCQGAGGGPNPTCCCSNTFPAFKILAAMALPLTVAISLITWRMQPRSYCGEVSLAKARFGSQLKARAADDVCTGKGQTGAT